MDFDKLHALASRLAELTAPENRQEGVTGWCIMTGEVWRLIAEMWDPSLAAKGE